MKNIKKIFNVVLALLIVVVITITTVPIINAAPKNVTIDREGVMVSYIGDNYKWAKFKTSDGKIAYCMDLEKKWPERATNISLVKEGDAGLTYILQNGYPYKSIKGNDDVDRFITQAAVWWYLSDTGQTGALSKDFTTNAADPQGLRSYIQKLVNDAKNAKSSAKSTLDVKVNNSNMALSDDGNYFISEEISPVLTGVSSYKVSVSGAPQGTVVVNSNGTSQDTFKSGEKFRVRIPSNSLGQTTTIKVTVSATSTTNKAYIYQPSDTSYQRVVVLYTDNGELSKTVSLTAKVDKPKVCVDYVIVGDVRPDPALTDPTPGTSCYDKGTKYDQENGLTTRQENCKFNGWYTKEDLTGKWVDGTPLNNNMTLYGAWDCGTSVDVPNTAANISFIILGAGVLVIASGVAILIYRDKKLKSNK